MDEEEYTIIVKLLKGTFNVPVSRRTRVQKSAIVKYWRLKEELSLDTNGALLHQGKRVLRKNEINEIVSKTFRSSKSGGYKKLRARAADGYAGISNRNVLKVTSTDFKYKQFNAKFKNKAVIKPIIAKKVRDKFSSYFNCL